MKKHYFYVGILAFLTLSSCSQEVEESQEQQRKELRSSSSIKELTEQLKHTTPSSAHQPLWSRRKPFRGFPR